jgi:hypothetical protein
MHALDRFEQDYQRKQQEEDGSSVVPRGQFFLRGIYRRSALSPYLFALVMDEVTRDIQGGIPWCMLFVDDVVLVDESRTGVDQKLELWR